MAATLDLGTTPPPATPGSGPSRAPAEQARKSRACRPGGQPGAAAALGRRIAVALLALLAALPPRAAARAGEPVDLELVLAVDVSSSISRHEYELQMRGLAEAFRSAAVRGTIRRFAPNGVAVTLMQWAGTDEQAVKVPWHLVRDDAGAESVAAAIDLSLRLSEYGGTAIGDALLAAGGLFRQSGFTGARRVIDVSGDGHANLGLDPRQARDAVLSRGITVNALAILNEEPDLDRYYADNVIGGAGAFVVQAADFADFARAIEAKLVREIGGAQLARLGLAERRAGPFPGPLRPPPPSPAGRGDR